MSAVVKPRSRTVKAGGTSAQIQGQRNNAVWKGTAAVLFGICYVLLTYTEPIVFFRYIVGQGDLVGGVLGAVLLGIAAISGTTLIRKTDVGLSRAAAGFFVYSTFTTANLYLAGAKSTSTIERIPPIILGVFALTLIRAPGFTRYFAALLALGMCMNALALWLVPNLGSGTSAELGVYFDSDAGIFGGRHAGLLGIPGFAAFYAVQGVAVCLANYLEERRWFWAVGCGASLVLGFSTGNRSFVASGLVVCCALPIVFVGKSLGRLVIGVVAVLLLLGAAFFVWRDTAYGGLMIERFDEATMDVDVDTRTRGAAGILPSLEAVPRNPWRGAAYVDTEGGVYVYNGTEYLQPHMGWVWLVTSQGVFAFLFLATWHIWGGLGLARARKWERELVGTRQASGWLLAFIGGQVVSLSDPMLECPPMFFAAALGTYLLAAGRSPSRAGVFRAPESEVVPSVGACGVMD